MAQCPIGGATSYEEQSLKDILSDINNWINYTYDRKAFIIEHKGRLQKNKYWDKIPYDFQITIFSTISYFETILFDLKLVKTAILNNCITDKEVILLYKIGRKAIEYNNEYPKTFKEDRKYWHDYGNPNFIIAEEIYGKGRDYFVTMLDAANAAHRLHDYIERGQIINNTINAGGSINSAQIQQGTNNSKQTLETENTFNYEQILRALVKIQKTLDNNNFTEDFGLNNANQIKSTIVETIQMIKMQDKPSKIKKALLSIKNLAVGVTESVIATGICGIIAQLPIW